MATLSAGNDKFAKDICDALGLKNVTSLDLHMAIGSITTVTAEFYPEIDGVMQLPAILKKFALIPIDEKGE